MEQGEPAGGPLRGRKREAAGRAGTKIKTDCPADRRIGTAGHVAERAKYRVGADEGNHERERNHGYPVKISRRHSKVEYSEAA